MAETVNIDINTGNSRQGISELRKEMRELRGEMSQAEGEEFQKLSQRASELNAEIGRTNSLVTDSGSAFTNFNTLLGRTGKSLLTLDFGQAAEQAQALQRVASQMTFKTLTTGLKQATGAFRTLGKALLANPLFLIAGIIIAVGVAVYKLMEELGLLEPILDAIGAAFDFLMIPIRALIDGLKALTDWLGWTTNAEDELAEEAKRAAEKRRKAHERANKAIVGNLEREIELMKAQGAEIDAIEEKEFELAKARAVNARVTSNAELARLKALQASGAITEEQRDRILEINEEIKNSDNNLEIFIANRQRRLQEEEEDNKEKSIERAKEKAKAIEEVEERSANFILNLERKEEEQKIKAFEDDIQRERALALFKLEKAKEDIDFSEMNAEAKAKWKQWEEDEIERIETEAFNKKLEREEEERIKLQEEKEKFLESIREEEQLTAEEQAEEDFNKEIERMKELLDAKAITQEEYDQLEIDRKEALSKRLEQIEQDRLDKEDKMRKEAQKAAIDSGRDLFENMAEFAEEGSAAQKAASLVSILASQGEALAKSIPVALEASSGTGPAAPFVFASTLAGIGASIAGTVGSAMSILNSAPGDSASGGGSTTNTTPTQPTVTTPRQPSFSNFNDELAGDIGGGQSVGDSGTYILDSELSSREERKAQMQQKKVF